jgi:hypothetical protein
VRFLIISKNKYMAPPEVLSDLIDGTLAWTRKYQAQIKEIWSFAGQQAGAAIANVKSPEELDTMEVYPLVDLDVSLRHQKESLHAMGVPA